jgi:hypothetical protein
MTTVTHLLRLFGTAGQTGGAGSRYAPPSRTIRVPPHGRPWPASLEADEIRRLEAEPGEPPRDGAAAGKDRSTMKHNIGQRFAPG